MILRISAKLGKKIGDAPEGILPAARNPYADWSGHLFRVERIQYIIVVNTASLYSVVIPGRGIRDDSDLIQAFLSQLRDVADEDGYGLIFKKCVLPETGEVAFSKALNRSVTGTINDAVNQCWFYFAEQDMSPFQASMTLNGSPFGMLGHLTPRKAFARMRLEAWPGMKASADSCE